MKTLLRALVAASLALTAIGASAGDPQERQVSFVIESKTLADALDQWAQQTGFQIFVSNWEMAKKINAPRLRGKFPARVALDKLLEGTSLGYSWVGDHAVSITEKSSQLPTTLQSGGLHDQQHPLRVAQLDTESSPRSDVSGSGSQRKVVRDRAERLERDASAVEEIVVTGSRLGVRGEGVSPVTTFDSKKLSTLGVSTVSDAMRYISQQPFTQAPYSQSDGAVFAEMRGLGVDATLVLINGRRAVPSAATVSRNAFDLNSIPLPAIDRIEVLSDSASAIYGADAVGGVVNIILKREVAQPTVELSYGSADGGADERRAAFSAGISGESLNASFIFDYFDRGALLGADRERLRNQDFRRFGAADRTFTEADPGNVSSLTGQNLPGLDSPFAAVPVGSSGTMSVADFAATAGTQNRESLDRYRAIVPEAKRLSAGAFLELSLPLEGATAFGEFLYSDRETTTQFFPPTSFGFVVPAENPYNPFGQPVFVNRLLTELGPQRTETDSQMYRAVLGSRLSMGAWDIELSALASREDSTSVLSNRLNFAQLAAAASATDPTRAINPFQDGPLGSAQVLAALEVAPTRNAYASDGYQGSAILRGDLFEIAAGSVALAAGVEWRKEEMLFDDFIHVEHDRRVAASFAELRVPIIGRDQAIPWFEDVWASAAVRYDDYSDFGGTVNPQLGIAWRTSPNLLLRASYGTAFRPPSLYELFAPQIPVPGFAIDPRRNNEVSFPTFTTGGNPDLDPIEATSFSGGFVLTPAAVPGFRASASYWKISLEDRVAFFQPDLVLANEARYPDRVIRSAATPADVAAGRPGALMNINMTPINFGTLDTSGVDLAAEYAFNIGAARLTPSLTATWVDEYDAVNVPNTPAQNRVNIANGNGSITRWKAIGALTWAWNGLSVVATGRYTPTYRDFNAETQLPSARMIDAQTIVDIQASLRTDDMPMGAPTWLAGTQLALGVINLFDDAPRYSDVGFLSGYDPTIGDLRQRFAYLRLSKAF